MEIGKKICDYRKKNGLSQNQLADELNVTRQTISNWEIGQTTPDINQAKELANFFNISLDELTDNDVKDVLVKKLINTEKITNKIMNILKCLIIVIIGWTAIMIVAIYICYNQLNIEQMKIEECNVKYQKYIESLKKENYIGKIKGNEFKITVFYDVNKIIDSIQVSFVKANENTYAINQNLQNKEWEEFINYIDNNYRNENEHRPLSQFKEETKVYFESKNGSFELLDN